MNELHVQKYQNGSYREGCELNFLWNMSEMRYWIIFYVVPIPVFVSVRISDFYAKNWSLYADIPMFPSKWTEL